MRRGCGSETLGGNGSIQSIWRQRWSAWGAIEKQTGTPFPLVYAEYTASVGGFSMALDDLSSHGQQLYIISGELVKRALDHTGLGRLVYNDILV